MDFSGGLPGHHVRCISLVMINRTFALMAGMFWLSGLLSGLAIAYAPWLGVWLRLWWEGGLH